MASTVRTGAVASVRGNQEQRASLGGCELRDGLFVQEWDDGSIYEGGFANGLKHGSGKYKWASGEVIQRESREADVLPSVSYLSHAWRLLCCFDDLLDRNLNLSPLCLNVTL